MVSKAKVCEVLRFPVVSGYNLNDEALRGEAYRWAKQEQEQYCPSLKSANYTKLEDSYDDPNHHQAFFADPECPDKVLSRHFWPSYGKVAYYNVANYKDLEKEHPELVRRFFINGVFAYLTTGVAKKNLRRPG